MMRISIYVMLIMVMLVSCKKKPNKGIMSQQKMEAVMWDFIRADVYTFGFLKKDSLINDTLENARLQNKIFANYKITRDEFYRSYQYYIENPEIMHAILDSISVKQGKLANEIKPIEL